jgi:CBS domain-containing protein
MRARELMSTPVVSVHPDASLKEIAERMIAHRVSGVPVVDHSGRLVGMISESDLVSKLAYERKEQGLIGLLDHLADAVGANRKLHARSAVELMTSKVVTAGPEASVRELIHLMTTRSVNRLPIVEDGRVIGIIARADILRTLVRPDAAITEDVRWRLLHDLWIDPTGLKISTRDGIVTLAGEVGTRSEAELVEQWTAATEGVVEVDSGSLRYRTDDRHAELPNGHLKTPTGDLR